MIQAGRHQSMPEVSEDLRKERKAIYRILAGLSEENLMVLECYTAFLRHIQRVEDDEDLRDAQASLMEKGDNIPWEQVRRDLNIRHGI